MLRLLAVLLSVLLIPVMLTAQPGPSSRNSYWIPNRDTVRVFVVFAEVVGDPDDRTGMESYSGWPRGQMPPNADTYFDASLAPGAKPRTDMTRFFHEGSFGHYVLLGDYYPKLVQIPYGKLKGNGDENVLSFLDALPGEDLRTKNGYSLNGTDFDSWTVPGGKGLEKEKESDGLVDFFMIIWRVNSRVSRADNGGSVNVSARNRSFKGKDGFMDFSRFVARHSSAFQILRHEFSHSLYGGNNFHTGGRGAGNATFIHAMGGFSNLSSFGANSPALNAWDRHRMGWKPTDHPYFIQATCASTGKAVATDLKYGDNGVCPGMAFWLDDFVDRGDAIRIELPYVQEANADARRQYLWLENHQRRPGRIDHEAPMPRGIYAFVQIGKDDTASFDGPGLYTAPLNALGNHDVVMDPESQSMTIWRGMENAFSGLNLNVIPASNNVEPNFRLSSKGDTTWVQRHKILREETIYPKAVYFRGSALPESDFVYETHPALGTAYDGFTPGAVIAVGKNPAPTPLLTWEQRGSNGAEPYARPRPDDNRVIPLNGIRVAVQEQAPDGRVLVQLSWDGESIAGKQRWCGPLVAYEDLNVASKARLDLDLGLTPTKPVDPLRIGRRAVFADTTVLTLTPGTTLRLDRKARLTLRNGSRLLVEPGATLDLGDKTRLQVMEGGSLVLQPGSRLLLGRKVRLEEKGGQILNRCAEAPFGPSAEGH